MTVLIPAFEPDTHLIELLRTLKGVRTVVVDDGSGKRYGPIFARARACGSIVLSHAVNRGKGCALKTGFAYILQNLNEREGVVTADADGQHRAADIFRVAEKMRQTRRGIVLGVRSPRGHVPLRSSFGNLVMRGIFLLASGRRVRDTQTGLRGIPAGLLPLMLRVRGSRFEYEINMLLDLANAGYSFSQVPIETVYTKRNASSHFRPLADSVRVLLPTMRFCIGSVSAAAADYLLLFVFQGLLHSLFLAVFAARAASSAIQYGMNRSLVFHSRLTARKPPHRAAQYYTLVLALLLINYLMLKFFSEVLGIWLPWAKLLTEFILFFVSYAAQRLFVFKHPALG